MKTSTLTSALMQKPEDDITASSSVAGCKTLSVPEAGKLYFGLQRDAAYNAAKRGQIPTIRMGRTLRVPIVRLEKMLMGAGE
jgi:hypothetical protein